MILLSLVILRIKTLRSFGNLDFLASLGRFNGTWIEHLEIKMCIARKSNSSGETCANSWIQFVNLRDCERFIQSDLLVLIELDISAIQKYVIIIIKIKLFK